MTRSKKTVALKEAGHSQPDLFEYHIRWSTPNFVWHRTELLSSVFSDHDKTLECKILVDPCFKRGHDICVPVYVAGVDFRGGIFQEAEDVHSKCEPVRHAHGSRLVRRRMVGIGNIVGIGCPSSRDR